MRPAAALWGPLLLLLEVVVTRAWEYHQGHHHPRVAFQAADGVPAPWPPRSSRTPRMEDTSPEQLVSSMASSIAGESQEPEVESPRDTLQPYGLHLAQAMYFRSFTNIMESPTDKSCTVASDCTKKCISSCQLALVDYKCATTTCQDVCRPKDCSGDVPYHPKGENCQYICEGNCLQSCREEADEALLAKFEECFAKKHLGCMAACTKDQKLSNGICDRGCKLTARSSCTSSAASDCLGSCGHHACTSQGHCKCPFFLKGNRMCTAYTWMRDVVPDHVKYCFQSPFEQKFQQTKFGDWHRPSISVGFLYENHRSNAQVLDANRNYTMKFPVTPLQPKVPYLPSPDLTDLADFSSCAVVGNSGVLTGKGLGKEIDNHTSVIRFNDAPTAGYESDVGSKTTMRLENNMYCGFCEKEGEILFPYTISSIENFCYPRMNRPHCHAYKSSYELRNFVTRFFEPLLKQFAENSTWVNNKESVYKGIRADARGVDPISEVPKYKAVYDDDQENPDPVPAREVLGDTNRGRGSPRRLLGDKASVTQQWEGKDVNLKDISAGMTGILMAMHMCHKVDVYGFLGGDESYYYPKIKRPDRDWGMLHYWELERVCLNAYNNYVSHVNFH